MNGRWLGANGGEHKPPECLLLHGPDLLRLHLGLCNKEDCRSKPFLKCAGLPPIVLGGFDNAAPKGGLPAGGKLMMQEQPSSLDYADHVEVECRTSQIGRQQAVSDPALRKIDNGPSNDPLNAGRMIGGSGHGVAHNGSEGAARPRHEFIIREGRPVPVRSRQGDCAVGSSFGEYLIHNGLPQSGLEPGHAGLQAQRLS